MAEGINQPKVEVANATLAAGDMADSQGVTDPTTSDEVTQVNEAFMSVDSDTDKLSHESAKNVPSVQDTDMATPQIHPQHANPEQPKLREDEPKAQRSHDSQQLCQTPQLEAFKISQSKSDLLELQVKFHES